MAFNSLWKRSIMPLAIGWYEVVRIRLQPNRCISCCHKLDSNCFPLSVVIVEGIPKCEIHPLTKACATVWVVISGIGTASGHLVNLSMQVSKYVLPFDTGRGPTISTCTWSNLASGIVKVPRGVIVCHCTSVFWHWMHNCVQRRISLLIFGHTSWVVSSLCDARTPGWAREWRKSNTCHLNSLGTYGRGTPVDTMQIMVAFVAGIGIACTLWDVLSNWVSSESICCSASMVVKSMLGH